MLFLPPHHGCSDNGILMMPNTDYRMSFTSWSPFTADDFTSNLLLRSACMHAHKASGSMEYGSWYRSVGTTNGQNYPRVVDIVVVMVTVFRISTYLVITVSAKNSCQLGYCMLWHHASYHQRNTRIVSSTAWIFESLIVMVCHCTFLYTYCLTLALSLQWKYISKPFGCVMWFELWAYIQHIYVTRLWKVYVSY